MVVRSAVKAFVALALLVDKRLQAERIRRERNVLCAGANLDHPDRRTSRNRRTRQSPGGFALRPTR